MECVDQRCERALVTAVRRTGASRQQARAAARRFVRAHRADRSYLEWVLRSVAATTALAVALLGLGAGPARAKATLFDVAPDNPLAAFDVGGFSSVAAGDADADGDPDFVASQSFSAGAIHYFQNTGTVQAPNLIEITDATNPFDGLSRAARRASRSATSMPTATSTSSRAATPPANPPACS